MLMVMVMLRVVVRSLLKMSCKEILMVMVMLRVVIRSLLKMSRYGI